MLNAPATSMSPNGRAKLNSSTAHLDASFIAPVCRVADIGSSITRTTTVMDDTRLLRCTPDGT